MKAYALPSGDGWTYHYDIDFRVKAGEVGRGRRVAVLQYSTRKGEEPGFHTHRIEDEAASGGWGGFVSDLENGAELKSAPTPPGRS